jgi:hypothetical protein
MTDFRAELDKTRGAGASVEQVAQIVYENAMLATAPDHAKPHWPSWADLPNSDARIHALNTADIILTRWGRPVASPAGDGPSLEVLGPLISWLVEEATQAADEDCPKTAGMLTWAAQVVGERVDEDAPWGNLAPAPKLIPLSERLPEDADCLVIPPLGASTFPLRYCWQAREIMHCGQARLIWDWKLVPHTTEQHWPFTYWLPASTRFLPTEVDPAQPT